MSRKKEHNSPSLAPLRERLKTRLDKILATIEKNVPLEATEKPLASTPISFRFGPVGPLARQRGEEPVLNVRFISPGGGLRQIKAQAAQLIEETAVEIETNISELLPPEFQRNILNSKIISDRWPWVSPQNEEHPIPVNAALKVLIRNFPSSLPLYEREPNQLPPEVAPLDVLEWIRYDLNLAELTANWTTLDNVEWQKTDDPKQRWHSPASGFALLYIAVHQQSQPIIAIDAGRPHHVFVETCRDHATRRRGSFGEKRDDEIFSDENRLYLVEKGKPIQLELALPLEEGPQAAVLDGLRRLFKVEGLRHWTALLKLWSVEGGRTGRVRWTLDEHLAALGYSGKTRRKPETRDRIAHMVESMARIELVVFGADRKERLRAPLIHIETAHEVATDEGKWRVEGMMLRANEALYSGVREPRTGRLGSNYWPVPPPLAQIDHVRHPHSIPLGLLLAIRWRWATNNSQDHVALKGENLIRLAGASANQHNVARTLDNLERDLTELQSKEVVGSWKWDEAPSPTSVVRIWPSHWSADLVSGRRKLLEARSDPDIPTTGNELREWREARNWTQQELADRLGVARTTVARAEAKERLSARLTRSLRKANSNVAKTGTPRGTDVAKTGTPRGTDVAKTGTPRER